MGDILQQSPLRREEGGHTIRHRVECTCELPKFVLAVGAHTRAEIPLPEILHCELKLSNGIGKMPCERPAKRRQECEDDDMKFRLKEPGQERTLPEQQEVNVLAIF